MGGGLGRVTKHPDYYLSDGSVSFLTGNTLFRVHRSFFERESDVFRDLFASAVAEDPHSGTDARPYTLDVKPDDFAQILWVWYDRDYSYERQSKTKWVTVLHLASRWEFPKIKELAIRELDGLGLSPAERISIYNQHGIDDEDRLLDSYVELCKSPTVPSEEEGNLMKMETLINVLQAREDAQRKAYKLRQESPTSAGLEDETLREVVSRFFKTGLNPRLNGTAGSSGAGVQASSLNGEHPQGTRAISTIIMGEPQVPDRTQSGGRSSHANNSQTAEYGDIKGDLAKVMKEKEKEEKEKLERARQAKEKEEKEKEKAEKAQLAKEREEKEKAEKVRQAKEREMKERAEKEREKEKEKEKEKERERARKAEEQKRPETPVRKTWGRP